MVTDQQIRLYKKERRAGRSQETAAAMAGMTAKTSETHGNDERKAGRSVSRFCTRFHTHVHLTSVLRSFLLASLADQDMPAMRDDL